jgi:hypothetical protein
MFRWGDGKERAVPAGFVFWFTRTLKLDVVWQFNFHGAAVGAVPLCLVSSAGIADAAEACLPDDASKTDKCKARARIHKTMSALRSSMAFLREMAERGPDWSAANSADLDQALANGDSTGVRLLSNQLWKVATSNAQDEINMSNWRAELRGSKKARNQPVVNYTLGTLSVWIDTRKKQISAAAAQAAGDANDDDEQADANGDDDEET